MKFIRIFPEIWARIRCLFFNSTRNIALGRVSTTVPSTSMGSSFCILSLTRFRAETPGTLGCLGQDLSPVIPHYHAVFKVRTGPAVGSDGGPFVL